MENEKIDFHFKGFIKGYKVDRIISKASLGLKPSAIYVLRVSCLSYEAGNLYVEIHDYKTLSDMRIFF